MKELIYHRGFLPAIRNFAQRPFIVDGRYKASYAEHGARVFKLIDALRNQLGLKKGDRFAVISVNSHEFMELYHAAFLGAGVITPLNTRMAEHELQYIISDSNSKVIFADTNSIEVVNRIVQFGECDGPKPQVVLIGGGEETCDQRYEELLSNASDETPLESDENDTVAIMYTGGTTGLPKGVINTQRSEMLNCYHGSMAIDVFGPAEVYLLQTPMFHAASMIGILSAALGGGLTVISPKFDAEGMLDLTEKYGVTTTTMVPTMIAMMLNAPGFRADRIQSLRSIAYGASPMPAELLAKLFEATENLELIQAYGMTEAGSLLTVLNAKDHRIGGPRLNSVGKPVQGIEICIQNADGELVASGEVGEVCAKGGNFMFGYLNKRKETADVFRGGWYHTGDAGYLDEGRYLYLVDRIKDMIVSGGENIYSIEVERAISSHHGVSQVAVIGIPHDVWGEAVHAIVVPADGIAITEQEIIAHTQQRIARYKAPKSVEIRNEPLPLSGALKVLKRELRRPYWQS